MQATLPHYSTPEAMAVGGTKLPCGCLQVCLEDSSGHRWTTVSPTYTIMLKQNPCFQHFPSQSCG